MLRRKRCLTLTIKEKLKRIINCLMTNPVCTSVSFQQNAKEKGVSAIDIAKFLIDQGIHPPTVYFL